MTMTKRFRGGVATMVITGGIQLLGGCAVDETAPVTGSEDTASTIKDDGNPVFPITARPYGQDLQFWAEEWWRWVYSVPAENNPFLHPGMDSNQNQTGPVFFLVPGNRTNTVPRNWAIAVPTS